MGTAIHRYGFTTELTLPDIRFRETRESPFDLYGFYSPHTETLYRRLPEEVATATSPEVATRALESAGGRVRFCTDSQYVALHAVMPQMNNWEIMARTGSSGFDLYVLEGARYRFYGTMRPGIAPDKHGFESVIRFPDRRLRQIMLHFPIFSQVENLYIGLQNDAVQDHGCRYRYDKPVVYYGSSITQGGCASRPGNTYQAILSMEYDCDFVNLGFAGSAKGEAAIRDYIAQLDMSVFVLDYDHNAPNAAHLRATHAPFYQAVRAAHPHVPIVMITAPNTQKRYHAPSARHDDYRAVVFETYQKARESGDENVYYIDGDALFEGRHSDICTVDSIHPNDMGFLRMAEKIGAVIGSLLY